MLRNIVMALAVLMTLGGLVLVVCTGPGGAGPLVGSLVLLLGTVFERVRYKRLATGAPDSRFHRTAERFHDPESGAAITVYADPNTGERVYVKD